MAKTKKVATENGEMDSVSKIEAIKNLIFGENIEQYNSEFDTLKKELEKRRKELQDTIEDIRTELMQSIDNLSTDVNIRITEVEDHLKEKIEDVDQSKVNRSDLGDLLISLGEKIKS